MDNNQFKFQVNLKGIIELLSKHIYSNPNVFVRELLQNGVDAITARKSIDDFKEEAVNVHLTTDTDNCRLVFTDNGVGLKKSEIHEFLAVIGQSSKRDNFMAKDFIGRFGIGLLSCLVVSDEIILETKSLLNSEANRWIGRSDGTYEIEAITENISFGSKVILKPRKEWMHLFMSEELKRNLLYFGKVLSIPINLEIDDKTEVINDTQPVWLDTNSDTEALLTYGKKEFYTNALDVFRLKTKSGKINGVAYIVPNKVQLTSNQSHKIYLKRMYLTDQVENLLPKWTYFAKCILNIEELSPTASRENLVNDQLLKDAQSELAECFKNYLKVKALDDPEGFYKIINVHHLSIKAIAVEDRELLDLFIDYMPFETNKGFQSFKSILAYSGKIHYTPSLDNYRQIRRIASSQGLVVINAAYSYEADILKKIKNIRPDIDIEEITPQKVLQNFGDIDSQTKQKHTSFIDSANLVLKQQHCTVELKHLTPKDTPLIFLASDDILNSKKLQQKKQTNNPFASTLGAFTDEKQSPTLCFNVDNKLIQEIFKLVSTPVFKPIINIMYVQALLLGQYPVNNKEMELFNKSLHDLLKSGVTDFMDYLKTNISHN